MNHADISGWTIRQYASADKFLWDDFLVDARNATFLFYRDYMDYHADRFKDASLLCFREGRLEALLPAHFSEGIFHSHGGLTYGGFIVYRQHGNRLVQPGHQKGARKGYGVELL